MSAPPPDSQSLRSFSSATGVGPKLEGEVDRSSPPATAAANRGVGSRSTRQQRLSFSSLAPSPAKPIPENQKWLGDAAAREDKPPPPPPQRGEVPVINAKEDEEEEEVRRTWNLRPRRSCAGSKRSNGVFSPEACGGASEVKHQKSGGGMEPKSTRQRGLPAESPGLGGGEVRNDNLRLWVALSRDEIEEDIFSMSGSRPSRRPRKRPKTLQKHLDVMFPGLCLVGLNADCFKAANAQPKDVLSTLTWSWVTITWICGAI